MRDGFIKKNYCNSVFSLTNNADMVAAKTKKSQTDFTKSLLKKILAEIHKIIWYLLGTFLVFSMFPSTLKICILYL